MTHLLIANLHFNPRSFGGATVVAEEVARRMGSVGEWRITLLSASYYGRVASPTIIRTALPGGIDHYTVNFGGFRTPDEEFENPAVTEALRDLIGRLAPDVAHVHCIQNLGVGLFDALEEAGVPSVLSTHDYWWLCERIFMLNRDGLYCGQETIDRAVCAKCAANGETIDWRWSKAREALSKPRFVTYPSDYSRMMHERNGVDPSKGVVVPNGVNPPAPDYAAKRTAKASPRLRFGYIGGPGPLKGWAMIERAFRSFSPEEVELVVVDAATLLGGSWWRTYDFGKIAPLVTVAPGYDQTGVDDFFAGLDVLLFLSTWKETFGLTSREAALRGVHVLATDCGAPIEPLIDGDTATILPGFGSAGDLEAAVARFVRDGAPSPSDAGRAKIAQNVGAYEDQAAKISALLREAMGR